MNFYSVSARRGQSHFPYIRFVFRFLWGRALEENGVFSYFSCAIFFFSLSHALSLAPRSLNRASFHHLAMKGFASSVRRNIASDSLKSKRLSKEGDCFRIGVARCCKAFCGFFHGPATQLTVPVAVVAAAYLSRLFNKNMFCIYMLRLVLWRCCYCYYCCCTLEDNL